MSGVIRKGGVIVGGGLESGDAPFRDASLGVDERVADLLGRMSLEEKVGQVMQLDARGGVREPILERHVGSLLHASAGSLRQAHELVGRTRLRIPLIIGDDCIHGHSFFEGATIYPVQLGMASSFDTALVERMARATAEEVSTTGIHWTFSPVLCVARDTRWGRVDETFGEDPYVIGEMASAMVRGYQGGSALEGSLPKDAILATAKHFAGYSETQGGRDASEADLSHRKLRSWFLPPFERMAKEGCASFMMGYQSIDGLPVTINGWLLNDVLRGEWGYRGTLVTDWDNVGRMVWEQKVQPDYSHAAAAAVKAGNDLIMTTPDFYQGALDAIRQGLLEETELDGPVRRVLALKFRLGLFEDPRLPDLERQRVVVGSREHQELNLQAARESVVLLRNDGLLPLPADRGGSIALRDGGRRIAVVGPLADDAQTQLGDWAGGSGQCDWIDSQPREMITTILDGLRQQVPQDWHVDYAQGASILRLVDDPEGPTYPDGQPRPRIAAPASADPDLIAEAVRTAEQADYVVAVVGDVIQLVGEGRSTATLELYGDQKELLDALARTGKPMVVVLMSSKPLILPSSALGAKAILWQPSPGMKGGRALAEIMLGQTEPSGRLPITFPRHAGQLPVYYNQIRGQHGNRYADLTQDPLWAFGEGLAYTTFSYGQPVLEGPSRLREGDSLTLSVQVSNTGERFGTELVQLYISDIVTSVSWADRELKAFRRVDLAPGQTRSVRFELPVSKCSLVDADGRRVVEPGEFTAFVGHSSRLEDLHAVNFTVC
ncbi:glycoside hydrolase family 3 N-terminal domain-containing protein [Bifidobacterium xylocopae]|uniref:Exo-alpha-(1->6)-L-arabinopyranosidase n=1 Tax=Bifidobacterium xylocopae TaxID=2493119 RepID=A0A366KCV2_9BIFI|nr:glycoside hydrolase family 3 N-terminal domain-containing protein [Bifidobacterium xylocopae]RBP99052.1 beta-glucosidase [Bifidobacterium xylocopae]